MQVVALAVSSLVCIHWQLCEATARAAQGSGPSGRDVYGVYLCIGCVSRCVYWHLYVCVLWPMMGLC